MESNERSQEQERVAAKRPWEPPTLTYVGHAGEVLQGGGGKLSQVGGDPGENRKEVGSGR